jgi:hypothetical protein
VIARVAAAALTRAADIHDQLHPPVDLRHGAHLARGDVMRATRSGGVARAGAALMCAAMSCAGIDAFGRTRRR